MSKLILFTGVPNPKTLMDLLKIYIISSLSEKMRAERVR